MAEKQLILVVGIYLFNFQVLKLNMKQFVQKLACLMFHIWVKCLLQGEGALAYLQKMMTNDVSKLKDGQAQYTAMCYENGGTVDDLAHL